MTPLQQLQHLQQQTQGSPTIQQHLANMIQASGIQVVGLHDIEKP